jgi:pantothenate kinase
MSVRSDGAAPGRPLDLGVPTFGSLAERARALAGSAPRTILGIAGPPGSGKSTLAERLGAELGDQAKVVPMDGFHLAQVELERLGRAARKGAVDTFDAGGFVAMLTRLRNNTEQTVYAPYFDRVREEPIAGAIAIDSEVPLVIVEGNYLLYDAPPWSHVYGLLDEAWFCAIDDGERLSRLVERHRSFGRSPADAQAWAAGTDQVNADLVERTRQRARVVFSGWEP